MSLQELNINLKNYFINSGFNYIELPLLFDADIFFEERCIRLLILQEKKNV